MRWPTSPTVFEGPQENLAERSTLDASSRIARVIFCMGDGYMILLHGFIEKTQNTPHADIALAMKRMKEVTS